VKNLIDSIWGASRIPTRDFPIKSLNSTYSGVSWQTKVETLRGKLKSHFCDAMVVTSLTEIAYLLNLRGGDFIYVPVFRAYLIVSQREIILYTNSSKISLQAQLKINFDFNTKTCIDEKICVM
jgi:Xaa-Pro aminopeptidase